MTLLAAFKALLYCHTLQDDLVVGTDIAGRTQVETEELIGFFVNLLALRSHLSNQMTFHQVLQHVRETALESYAHQELPFDLLVDALHLERSLTHLPLVPAIFVLQNAPQVPVNLKHLLVTPFEFDLGVARFDLAVFVRESEQNFILFWNYRTDLFDEATIARLTREFEVVLAGCTANPDIRLDELSATLGQPGSPSPQKGRLRLKGKERKAVDLTRIHLVQTSYLQPNQRLPLAITPALADVALAEWTANNRGWIEAELVKHGGLLFRGFEINSTTEFMAFARAIDAEARALNTSDFHFRNESGSFYNTSTDAVGWPERLFFFRSPLATPGSELYLADGRQVYQRLPGDLVEQFTNSTLGPQGPLTLRRHPETGQTALFTQPSPSTDEAIAAQVQKIYRSVAVSLRWQKGDILLLDTLLVAHTWSHLPSLELAVAIGQIKFFHTQED